MNHVFLFTISIAITALGLVASWGAAKRRGVASGTRGAAWSLVPLGAYLTGLTTFLADLVFSPVKWAGIVVLGLGGVLYVTSGVMLRRDAGSTVSEDSGGSRRGRSEETPKRAPASGASTAIEKRQQPVDPDLAEIEQILKTRGIS